MIRFIVFVAIILCSSVTSAGDYGYGYYGTYTYGPYHWLPEAERWRMKAEALEARQNYEFAASRAWLDKKEQGLNNLERARQLAARAKALQQQPGAPVPNPPAPAAGGKPVVMAPLDQRSQTVRQQMGEEWWREHGWKLKGY